MLDSYRRILGTPRHRSLQRDRAGRPAADLHGRPRASCCWSRAIGLLRRGRRGLGGLHDRQRDPGDPPGPAARQPRPGPGAERRQRGLRGRDVAADLVGRGRLADRRRRTCSRRWAAARSRRSAPASGPAGPTCSSAPAEVQTAYALEAVVDEAVFILGPILVTVLATAHRPRRRVWSRRSWPASAAAWPSAPSAPPSRRPTATTDSVGARPRMPWRTVIPLAVVCAALGILFGAAEVTTVAFADEQGSKAYAGPLLALWALGSLVAGVITGAVHWRRGPAVRVRWGALAMACAMAPLFFIGVGAADGADAPGRRPRHRADPGRHHVADRADGARRPADRGDGDHADRPGRRRRPRRDRRAALVVDHSGASAAYLVSLGAGVVAALAAQRPAPYRSPYRASAPTRRER